MKSRLWILSPIILFVLALAGMVSECEYNCVALESPHNTIDEVSYYTNASTSQLLAARQTSTSTTNIRLQSGSKRLNNAHKKGVSLHNGWQALQMIAGGGGARVSIIINIPFIKAHHKFISLGKLII